MKRYLICSDIDGTLMTNQQTISQKTLDFIHDLQKEGHLFFIATGRMCLSATKIAEMIGEKIGVIASNGGALLLDGNIIQHTLDQNCSLSIYRLAMTYDLPLFFFTTDTVYYSSILPGYFKNKTDQGRIDSGKQEAYQHIQDEQYLRQHSAQFINAIIISEDQLDNLQKVKDELSTYQDLSISSSFWNNIEIMPKGISKATAITSLQQHYQIPKENTISFGDGDNDIEMFKVSGISVAVENANDNIKSMTSHITTSNNEDGVYHFLKQFFSKESKHGK